MFFFSFARILLDNTEKNRSRLDSTRSITRKHRNQSNMKNYFTKSKKKYSDLKKSNVLSIRLPEQSNTICYHFEKIFFSFSNTWRVFLLFLFFSIKSAGKFSCICLCGTWLLYIRTSNTHTPTINSLIRCLWVCGYIHHNNRLQWVNVWLLQGRVSPVRVYIVHPYINGCDI